MQNEPKLSRFSPVPRARLAQDLAALEERTAAIRWSLRQAARQARVPSVATSKWKSEPPMGDTYLRHMSRLQTAVDEEERRLLAYLQKSVPRSRNQRA